MVDVDWQLLGKAMFHYECAGFKPLTVPWSVPNDVAMVTCPDQDRMYAFEDEVLVGSAEQAFMAMQFQGQLPPGGMWLAPMFSERAVLDDLHQKYFMKVELYSTEENQVGKALELAKAAQNFMKAWGQVQKPEIVKTEEGFDLVVAGVESVHIPHESTTALFGHVVQVWRSRDCLPRGNSRIKKAASDNLWLSGLMISRCFTPSLLVAQCRRERRCKACRQEALSTFRASRDSRRAQGRCRERTVPASSCERRSTDFHFLS